MKIKGSLKTAIVAATIVAMGIPGYATDTDSHMEVKGERLIEKSDTRVKMNVKTALVFYRNVNANEIEVYVKDGMVTLKGTTSSLSQKKHTTEYVKDIDGVKGVNNELMVGKSKQTLGEKLDDASITAQVKTVLMLRHSARAIKTTIVTNNGIVTVSGEAKNTTERNLVIKIVEDVSGVRGVVNNLTTKK